ncbi:hypothetical protein M9H77_18915 [Catharanthus roseus]|uniref:Uncharacterized protein n=1 Tax=Catharanthus roseus TaxID=4058 RepID=A0ACC0B8T5_CATRO|nr:hypothetical protein M9H77_18915 [Catharanthus roseus]
MGSITEDKLLRPQLRPLPLPVSLGACGSLPLSREPELELEPEPNLDPEPEPEPKRLTFFVFFRLFVTHTSGGDVNGIPGSSGKTEFKTPFTRRCISLTLDMGPVLSDARDW